MGLARAACVLGLAASVGCEPAVERERVVTPDSAAAAPVDSAYEARLAATGAEAARQLRETLVRRLTAAIDSGGPAGAIEVCATIAPAIADSVAGALGAGVEVKRTSRRVRNPRNAPDALEQEALAHFEAGLSSTGTLPASYVQPAGDGTYRYYEPLVIMPLCLQCHGPATSIRDEVRAALDARYPDDRAVDYQEGDFRGLIRVTLPAPSSE